MERIDKKYLKDLTFSSSRTREKEGKDGKKIIQHLPTERALQPEDVLSWKDYGETIVMVTADGHKYTVEKSSAAA